MPRVKSESELQRRWTDFSGGVGIAYDDGRTNGLLMATGILGLANELRPAPFQNATSCEPTTASEAQYFFEEKPDNLAANDAQLFAVYNSTGRIVSPGEITNSFMAVDLRNATYGTEVDSDQATAQEDPMGQPAKYQGNWFVPAGAVVYEFTTINSAGAAYVFATHSSPTNGADHLQLLGV